MISKTCNTFGKFAALFSFAMLSFPLFSQTQWPATVSLGGMTIQIFKPEIESFDKDRISLRAALVITEGEENVFGSAWVDAASQSSKTSRTISLLNAKVVDLRFPDGYEAGGESALIAAVERGFAGVTIKMEDVLADLDKTRGEQDLSKKLNNAPPTIFYATRPSILVTIDGDPVLQPTDMAAVEMIVNSPFLILKHGGMFWLSNGSLWYESKSPLKGWTPRGNVPVPVRQTAEALKSDSEEENETEENESFHPDVIVSTVPAELIQTEGAPAFAAIPGTMMLYVTNTTDQIVMDIKSQTYFALLSGRWYSSPRLDGEWRYRAFDELPADFAKIPEGSDKDILLASVPGTKAAKDAVRESLVPQAAIVDRTTASTEVAYDGSPRFEAIEGTSMKYAVNGSSTVILENGRYYAVDDGVWYHSSTPAGPWAVSDARPVQIELIHPSCPIYNVRYVRVYHSTPRYVYVGYTRGYLSSYVCGRVVVYGTGWHYRPWRGRCYYPRPCTWGYGVSYSPWSGWSVGFVYGSGWFRYSHPRAYHSYYPHYRHPVRRSSPRGGWWGPVVYRPPYCVPHTHYYGHSRAQVRTVPHYTIRSSSPRSSRNNVYVYNSGRGVRSGSPARTIASSSGRQNLTRSYGYQARPSSGRQNSQASSGRGSGGRQDSQASPGRGSGSGGRQDSNSSSGGSGGRQGAQTLPGSSNLSGQQGSQTSPGNSSGGRESTTPGRGSGGGRESTTPGRNSGGGRESTTPGRNSGGSRESQTTPGRNSGGSRESQSTPGRNSGGSRESTTPGRGPGIGRESQATPGRGSGGGRESQATPGRGSGSSRESLPRQNSVSSGRRESLPRQNSVSSGTNSGGRSNSSAASSSSGSGGRSSAPSSRSGGGRGQGEQQPSRTR
ncbi:MAG: hypothetical protein LBD35_05925 [Prevotellaceae bacterium]|nr:hypothetical protein [Prevotellaceae bacterium]